MDICQLRNSSTVRVYRLQASSRERTPRRTAVTTAAGRDPEVAGKPAAPAVDYVRRHLGPRGVMVGDRPSTDGAFAAALGWPFALVLSGIAGPDGDEPVPEPPPAYLRNRWIRTASYRCGLPSLL